MPKIAILGFSCLACCALLASASPLQTQNQPHLPAPSEAKDRNPTKFRAKSNLLVVRDGKGKPVEEKRLQTLRSVGRTVHRSV